MMHRLDYIHVPDNVTKSVLKELLAGITRCCSARRRRCQDVTETNSSQINQIGQLNNTFSKTDRIEISNGPNLFHKM